jgi:hypothetical protein
MAAFEIDGIVRSCWPDLQSLQLLVGAAGAGTWGQVSIGTFRWVRGTWGWAVNG